MVTTVEFGSREAARQVRDDPQYQAFLAETDDARETTVRLKDATPDSALSDITGMAADTKRHQADKAGQADLTRQERKQIDFSREGVNVPKVRSIKAIADNEGVNDYLQFADLTLTVDENRQLLKQASREERGQRGLGRDEMSDERVDQKLANAFNEQRENELGRAKQFALVDLDSEAQEFVQGEGFDIGFTQSNNRIRGQGEDFRRLEERHSKRSGKAQRVDERRSAKKTRNPIQWANNPGKFDFPGIDTVQPAKLHEQRSERAQEQDEAEIAPQADSKQQWAMHPDRYDWRNVDRPDSYGPTSEKRSPGLNSGEINSFLAQTSDADVSLAPEEGLLGVGATSSNAIGGFNLNASGETDRESREQKPPESALQAQSEEQSGGVMDNFTDDRDEESQLLDFGMETDATQHRESREAEEQATEFGVDDRSDASRGASNNTDDSEQGGLERFGGGTRENETLF